VNRSLNLSTALQSYPKITNPLAGSRSEWLFPEIHLDGAAAHFQQPWSAVASRLENANHKSLVARCDAHVLGPRCITKSRVLSGAGKDL